MEKKIEEKDGVLHISLTIPKWMTGTYQYDEEKKYKVPAVCVVINKDHDEYYLSHTMYLDYKDSLQSTQPIFYFDTEEEAREFVEKYKVPLLNRW